MKRAYIPSVILIFVIVLGACGSEDSPEKMAKEWTEASLASDIDGLSDLTCAAQKSNMQDTTIWSSILTGKRVEVDISELRYKTTGRNEGGVTIKVQGDVKATHYSESGLPGLVMTHWFDASYTMVEEGGTWKWCGVTGGQAVPTERRPILHKVGRAFGKIIGYGIGGLLAVVLVSAYALWVIEQGKSVLKTKSVNLSFRSPLAKWAFTLLSILFLGWLVLGAIVSPVTTLGIEVDLTASLIWVLPAAIAFSLLVVFFTVVDDPAQAGSSVGFGLLGVIVLTAIFLPTTFSATRSRRCSAIGPEAKLTKCVYEGHDLTGVNLREADLTGADLGETDLTNADLTGATLSDTDLRGANLTGARLAGADLDRADLYGAIGLTDDMLNGIASWRGTMLEDPKHIVEKLAVVCSKGQGVPKAADYTPDERFHPIVFLGMDGQEHPWTYTVPKEWWPSHLGLTTLVACCDTEERMRLIETCDYKGGTRIDRYVSQINVRLVEARTGELVAETTIMGDEPSGCPNKTEMGSNKKWYGDDVLDVKIVDIPSLTQRYIKPNGEMARLTVPK